MTLTYGAVRGVRAIAQVTPRCRLHASGRPSPLALESSLRICRHASSFSEAAPRIAQPSLWRSLIPKPLRRDPRPAPQASPSSKPQQKKEWNPFTVYIFIFLLIGSNAINLIGMRNELVTFSQKTDRQIALLKEVIRKIQDGEEVDVEAALGTGNPEREMDWEKAIKEIESTDAVYYNEVKRQQNAETTERLDQERKRKNLDKAERERRRKAWEDRQKQGSTGQQQISTTGEEPAKKRVGFY